MLDLGTGSGELVNEARLRGIQAIGIDLDSESIDTARLRYGPWFTQQDINNYKPPIRTEFISANFVINHSARPHTTVEVIRNYQQSATELRATIWPAGGAAWSKLFQDLLSQQAIFYRGSVRTLDPAHDFERSIEGFTALLKRAGWVNVETKEISKKWTVHKENLWTSATSNNNAFGRFLQNDLNVDQMRTLKNDYFQQYSQNEFIDIPISAIFSRASSV